MTIVLEGLVFTIVVLLCALLFARWQATRDDRRQRLLEESWAIYRASRHIHDKTTEALQAMLDAARAQKSDQP